MKPTETMFSLGNQETCETHYAEPTHPSVQYGLASKLFGNQTVFKRSFKIEF